MAIAANDLFAKLVLAGLRFFLASILLFSLVLIRKLTPIIEKRLWMQLFLLSILQISLQYFFFYNGLAHTSGMKGAILSSSGTFFIVVLAHFLYNNDKIDWRKAIGLGTGFIGIILVNYGKSLSFDFTWGGEGFMIISGLVSAFGTILAKRLAQRVDPLVLTAWQMLLGSVLLLLIGFPGLEPHAIVFSLGAVLLLLYSALLSAVAFSLWYSILKYNKAGVISVYQFMIPVTGAILSAVFIPGEKVTIYMFGALILVALGIVIVNRSDNIHILPRNSKC